MWEALKFTARLMKKWPLRSLLTILHVGLGVWIVATILSLNLQATEALHEADGILGDSLAKISAVNQTESNVRIAHFLPEDLAKLQGSGHIAATFILKQLNNPRIFVHGLTYDVSSAIEASAGYGRMMQPRLAEGQFFTEVDQKQRNKVILLSEIISKQLFPNQSAVGKTVGLGGRSVQEGESYEVIGIYELQSSLWDSFLPESHLIVPLESTVFEGLPPLLRPRYHQIYIQSKPGQVFQAVADAQALLTNTVNREVEFRPEYFSDSNFYAKQWVFNMTLYLGAFAFVSIVISGTGFLCINMVSVVERTREMGLRRALGATKTTVMGQVLNVALVFSVAGAILGLIAAYFSTSPLLELFVGYTSYSELAGNWGLHWQAAFISFALAVVPGQLFSLYPARLVAKMSAVEALRN